MSSHQHIQLQTESDKNFTEIPETWSRSGDRSSTESTEPRRRTPKPVSEANDNDEDDRVDNPDPSAVADELLPPKDTNRTMIAHRLGADRTKRPITIMVDGIETQVPDLNVYQTKKAAAQGLMDVALLTANVGQLRYVVESENRHAFFYLSLIFISLSIMLQVAVGVGLILGSRYDIEDYFERLKANRISNMTMIGILIITIVNIFIASFGPPISN